MQFRPADQMEANKLGDLLAPKQPWVELLGPLDGPQTGGLRTITMERSVRPDGYVGYVRVTLGPLPNSNEVRIDVNDHYELSSSDGQPIEGLAARDKLEEVWAASLARSNKIIEALLENCNVIV